MCSIATPKWIKIMNIHPYGFECTNILKVSNSLVLGVQKHVMTNEIAKFGI
jgi:hypothetical protein